MLAIILVDYRNEEKTVAYVRTELRCLSEPFKLVVVSNAATADGLRTLHEGLGGTLLTPDEAAPFGRRDVGEAELRLAAGRFSAGGDVFLLPSADNQGYARGNNMGARFARAVFQPDYLLITNNDIHIDNPRVATMLIDKLSAHTEAACIGPRVVGLDGREQSPQPYYTFFDNLIWSTWDYFLWSEERRRKYFKWDYAAQACEGLHYFVHGGFFIVRAADFFRVGGFDDGTFLYAEEHILAERLKRIGKGEYYDPRCTVVHEHCATVRKYFSAKRKNDMLFRSMCYYFRTYRGVGRMELLLGWLTHKFVNLCDWKKELVRRLRQKRRS